MSKKPAPAPPSNYLKFFMRSGGVVDFQREALDHFPLEDVLYALGKELRFFNQINWSVLQHSIACGLAAQMLYPYNTLLIKHTYLHDFSEAFLRDVPSVVKGDDHRAVEEEVQRKTFAFMGLPTLSPEDKELVHEIDLHIRLVEAYHMYSSDDAYEAIEAEQDSVDPKTLIACCHGVMKVVGMPMFGDDGEIHPGVVELFESVISRFSFS